MPSAALPRDYSRRCQGLPDSDLPTSTPIGFVLDEPTSNSSRRLRRTRLYSSTRTPHSCLMNTAPRRQVVRALHRLGFNATKGNGSGHTVFVDLCGRKVQAVVRSKKTHHVEATARSLEHFGVCTRREFFELVRRS